MEMEKIYFVEREIKALQQATRNKSQLFVSNKTKKKKFKGMISIKKLYFIAKERKMRNEKAIKE